MSDVKYKPGDRVVALRWPRDGAGVHSVLTGRPYGRLQHAALRPATMLEIQRAEAECAELANSPPPRHVDCEMARARANARRKLGMS